MEIKLGNIEIKKPVSLIRRMSVLIWGPSGCGKTTLASTMPGEILWINFDPDGTATLASLNGIHVVDFSDQPPNCVMKFRKENPLDLKSFLKENSKIKTVVFDSLTTYGDKAMYHGVVEAQSTSKGRGATLEDPGYAGYGNKNTWMRQCVKHMLAVTSVAGVHMVFIAHEDKPEKDSSGNLLYISIMLGSSLNVQIPVDLSEIWHLEDTGKKRRIAIRACRSYKPMKTRIFLTSKEPEFDWNYDAETGEGDRMEDWYKAWVDNGGKKIPLPN